MEDATGFNLNDATAEWRTALGAEEGIEADAVRELESHLREGIAELTRKGLTEEEAFLVASRRLGRAPKIAAEFQKEDPASVWRSRLFWMLIGISGQMLLANLAQLATAVCGILISAAFHLDEAAQRVGPNVSRLNSSVYINWVAFFLAPVAVYVCFRWLKHGNAERLNLSRFRLTRRGLSLALAGGLITSQWLHYILQALLFTFVSPGAMRLGTLNMAIMIVSPLISPMLLGWMAGQVAPANFVRERKAHSVS